MLWTVVWLAAAACVYGYPPSGSTQSSVFDSARPGNYTFHISVDRLEVQNVNFNVHLAVFLGNVANYPTFQPSWQQHHRPERPPVSSMMLGPVDYGRISPLVVAYPTPPPVTRNWGDGVVPAAEGLEGTSSPASSLPQRPTDPPRPENLGNSLPQQYSSHFSRLERIITTAPPQQLDIDSRPKELTTLSPQYSVPITRSEKLTTTSPPQYSDLEAHFQPETLQTF